MADESDDALKKHRDLLIACGWGKEVDVILLFQQGASVRVQDQDGKNCLHYSACKGHIQVTNLLIEHGCAINARDKVNRTPLHLAAEEGHNDIVSILLDNGAEFDVQDEDGYTPCHMACLNDHAEVLELLIHIKADLLLKSREGLSPLHIAAINSSIKSIPLLINAGVGSSPQDMQGNTPLHLAVQAESIKSLKCLIKHDVNVNAQNYEGDTPLHLCANLGYVQFADYILNCNQPVELSPNNVGDTAKDIAIRHGFREIVQIIPDPHNRKKKGKRKPRSSDSLEDTVQLSAHTSPVEQKEVQLSPQRKYQYQSSILGSPPGFLQHPSEEVPTATSSSMLSLWVPTTDSGISLPMDTKIEHNSGGQNAQRRKQKKAVDKSAIVADLKLRHRKNEKIQIHEYGELRKDPRFVATSSTKTSPKKTPKTSPTRHAVPASEYTTTGQNFSTTYGNGSVSDESVQYKGCFFKSKPKNVVSRQTSMKSCNKKHATDHDKELMMQRQAELHYQLNESKISLEKQMRKMRKKFEKALLATDHRFIEQKKREEMFHNQLRNELEIIEKSLEKGSKKNVVEFTNQIKTELNQLAVKLTGAGTLDLNTDGGTSECSANSSIKRGNKRTSAVDLNREISVSLNNMVNNDPRLRLQGNSCLNNNTLDSAELPTEERLRQTYEQRLKDLEDEVRQKATKERENEELRARVQELEKLIKTERSSNAVT